MVHPAAQAASAHSFNEAALRQTLQAIAQRSRATGEDIDRALEEGFRQEVAQAMSDGIITRDEEERLRALPRTALALKNSAADQGALARLDRAGGGPGRDGGPAGSHLRAGTGTATSRTWPSASDRRA